MQKCRKVETAQIIRRSQYITNIKSNGNAKSKLVSINKIFKWLRKKLEKAYAITSSNEKTC